MYIDDDGAHFSMSEVCADWWAYHGCPYCRSEIETLPCKNCGGDEPLKLFFRKGNPIK